MSQYCIRIKGKIPANLSARVSAAHADSILRRKESSVTGSIAAEGANQNDGEKRSEDAGQEGNRDERNLDSKETGKHFRIRDP